MEEELRQFKAEQAKKRMRRVKYIKILQEGTEKRKRQAAGEFAVLPEPVRKT